MPFPFIRDSIFMPIKFITKANHQTAMHVGDNPPGGKNENDENNNYAHEIMLFSFSFSVSISFFSSGEESCGSTAARWAE